MKKLILAVVFYVFLSIILLPALVTVLCSHREKKEKPAPAREDMIMEVYNPDIERMSSGELEDYIKGVVGAEMPALFPEEALKAQAVAARTYAVRKMREAKSNAVPYDIGQAYLTPDQLKERWGNHFGEYYEKVSDAVDATQDEIMVYEKEPILAVFHAESAGKTENSENVWEQEIPYLKSVDSSVDEQAPDFEKETTLTCDEVVRRLTGKQGDLGLTAENIGTNLEIMERSKAGYIQKVKVGTKVLTGKQVREALGLRSANFMIKQNAPNAITFVTRGYGHGAGMSQYGACFMAKEGKSYREILGHYYSGVEFQKWNQTKVFAE